MLDAALSEYRLFALNGQPGLPDREGVTLESAFVGPGMRKAALMAVHARHSVRPDFGAVRHAVHISMPYAQVPHRASTGMLPGR